MLLRTGPQEPAEGAACESPWPFHHPNASGPTCQAGLGAGCTMVKSTDQTLPPGGRPTRSSIVINKTNLKGTSWSLVQQRRGGCTGRLCKALRHMVQEAVGGQQGGCNEWGSGGGSHTGGSGANHVGPCEPLRRSWLLTTAISEEREVAGPQALGSLLVSLCSFAYPFPLSISLKWPLGHGWKIPKWPGAAPHPGL